MQRLQVDDNLHSLPESWRTDVATLRAMHARQLELKADREQEAAKVLCPWRPGGMHIAKVCEQLQLVMLSNSSHYECHVSVTYTRCHCHYYCYNYALDVLSTWAIDVQPCRPVATVYDYDSTSTGEIASTTALLSHNYGA
jgi:hypothetical protein